MKVALVMLLLVGCHKADGRSNPGRYEMQVERVSPFMSRFENCEVVCYKSEYLVCQWKKDPYCDDLIVPDVEEGD